MLTNASVHVEHVISMPAKGVPCSLCHPALNRFALVT
jgi:hypothetical protein